MFAEILRRHKYTGILYFDITIYTVFYIQVTQEIIVHRQIGEAQKSVFN